jgi:hypothetical protein
VEENNRNPIQQQEITMTGHTLNRLLAVLALLFTTPFIHAQNKPPIILLSVDNTNEFVDVGSAVTLTAQASDSDGYIQAVELYKNGSLVGNMGSSASREVIVEPGSTQYHAVAYDNNGASATSEVVRVSGNYPPTVSILEPKTTVSVYSLAEPILITAAASDPDGTVREVRLLENGTVIAADLQAPFEFLYKPNRYGSFNLQLLAFDNRDSAQASAIRTVHYVRVFDNLDFAIPLNSGTNHVLLGSNVGATHQKGEPKHAGVPTGKSIWFLWRPTTSGTVIIDTLGSDFDTVLAVYTNRLVQGITISNLVEIASNDNDAPIAPLSRVKFFVRAGTPYYIAVDGRDGMAGNIQLQIRHQPAGSQAPAHDFLASAATATSTHNSNNIGASKEPGEPNHAGNPGGASMWYRIALPTGQQSRISTEGSNFDTVLAVYINAASPFQTPTMDNLRLVAFNDDGPVTNRTSEIILTPTVSSTYWVAVDGYNGAQGNIRFSVTTLSQQIAPTNDFFAKATTLVGGSALARVNTVRATPEVADPAPLRDSVFAAPRSVWYRWIAPSTGPVYMTTAWSDFDTILAVYTGTNISALSLVASNDDDPAGGQTSALFFNATAGTQYHIGIAGYRGASGNLVFALNQNAFYIPRLVPQFQSGRMTLAIADISGPVILESSTDLVTWHYERTITSDQPLDIAISGEIPRAFYRVRTVE